MRYGIVIHGPEAIDTGLAMEVIQSLSKEGEVEVYLGGATGAAAVIDAGLDRVIDISIRQLPSEALSRLDHKVDCLVLVNCGKTEDTGMEFGRSVSCRTNSSKPLVQVDCDFVVAWNEKGIDLARWLADRFSKRIVIAKNKETSSDVRRITGVLKGENVLINGVVVGKAMTENVVIWKDSDGRLQFSGIEIKKHVLGRIGEIDLSKAIIRSGVTRRTYKEPRSVNTTKRPIACLIDHNAEKMAHEFKHAAVVVSIGDDTTMNAGSILRRYGVPIIGITDNDEDGICRNGDFSQGSVIFVLGEGSDDHAGIIIKERIFNNKSEIPFENLEVLERRIAEILNGKIKFVKRYNEVIPQ